MHKNCRDICGKIKYTYKYTWRRWACSVVNTSQCRRKVSCLVWDGLLCGTWHVFHCFGVGLSHTDRTAHTQRQTRTHAHPLSDISFRSAYHPHVGEKICSCYRSFLSAVHKRETPVCPRPPCALNGPANASSVQPIQRQHQEATYQICENCHTL